VTNLYNDPFWHWIVVLAAMLALLFSLVTATAYVVFLERVVIGHIQRRPAAWEEALSRIAAAIKGRGPRLGLSIPADITNEEAFLLARLLNGPLRGARVVMPGRTSLPGPPANQLAIKDLDGCRTIVVVAADVRADAPIVNLRVKKAVAKSGARLLTVNPELIDFDRHPGVEHVAYEPGHAAAAVRKLFDHPLLQEGPVGILYGDGAGAEDGAAIATGAGGGAGAGGTASAASAGYAAAASRWTWKIPR